MLSKEDKKFLHKLASQPLEVIEADLREAIRQNPKVAELIEAFAYLICPEQYEAEHNKNKKTRSR